MPVRIRRHSNGTNVLPSKGNIILAVGCGAWGKGKDSDTAINVWRANLGKWRNNINVVLYDCHKKTYVNEYGMLVRPVDTPPPKQIEIRTLSGG